MAAYNHHYISTETGEIIPLKFVESMRLRDAEEEVVDKLKGDVSIMIRTVSGKDYIISMNTYHKMYNQTNDDLAVSIYDKWLWINKPSKES